MSLLDDDNAIAKSFHVVDNADVKQRPVYLSITTFEVGVDEEHHDG
jgi:hypothetical protein